MFVLPSVVRIVLRFKKFFQETFTRNKCSYIYIVDKEVNLDYVDR